MQIKYDDPKVEKLFSDLMNIKISKGLMQKKIGAELTRKVKLRCDQIKAADNLEIYLSVGLGKPELLKGNLMECASVRISANYRLIFKPLFPEEKMNIINECKEIVVKGVMDYHGQGSHTWLLP